MVRIKPDESIIGLEGPVYDVDLERGRIRQFANSIYAFHPAYHKESKPVIPPTFLIMSGYFYGYILARAPRDSAFGSIDEDFTTCADGGQEFVFHGPLPRAGDPLVASTHMHDFKERQGRRGGRLRIYVTCTQFHTPGGHHVADWFEWNVKTSHSPVQSLDEARIRDRPYFMKGDPRDQFNAVGFQDWDALREGQGPGVIVMPPLTVTDIVAYQYASGEDGPTHHDDGSARACGYPAAERVRSAGDLARVLPVFLEQPGPALLEIQVALGSRAELGRPDRSPRENKEAFMRFIRES